MRKEPQWGFRLFSEAIRSFTEAPWAVSGSASPQPHLIPPLPGGSDCISLGKASWHLHHNKVSTSHAAQRSSEKENGRGQSSLDACGGVRGSCVFTVSPLGAESWPPVAVTSRASGTRRRDSTHEPQETDERLLLKRGHCGSGLDAPVVLMVELAMAATRYSRCCP